MNFDQVYAAAESNSNYLNDVRCLKVYISASADNTNAANVANCFQKEINQRGLDARIITAGSMGYYDIEPMVLIEKPGQCPILYNNVTSEIAREIVNDYIINGNPRPDLACCSIGGDEITGIPNISELPWFNLQNRIALRNCGYIDPENINHYIVRGKGYSGLSKALQLKQRDVIQELKKSCLRGRGGAGYFTANKWQICHDAEVSEKYTVCNAIDSDPRALTARLLLGSNPHSVLEGLLIGAYAIGAAHCFICVNVEDTRGIQTVRKAIEQMRQYNLLGSNILDSGFSVDIEIREVTTSLVSGEETALLRILEGRQARPYLRTNYAAPRGYNNNPTVVNDIETFSNVSGIFQNGPEWLSNIGTEESHGTKIITLAGEIAHKLTVEVPFGTTLRTLVKDIGGGVSDGKDIQAVQFGGCMGAFFPVNDLDTPITYETMEEAGSVIGSGTAVIIENGICPVEMAKEAISYLQIQSCGQCVFCREGTFQMSDILSDIAEFKGKHEDLEMLEELGNLMKTGCICGLGSAAPNPVQSSLRHFRQDYDAHINEKRCLAAG